MSAPYAMRDLLGWNLSLGLWAGVPVRVHVFFLLFAICAIHLSAGQQDLLYYALTGLAILFFSVLAHELGHCYAAGRMGGTVEQVVLWPLGGLVPVNVTHDPRDECWTAAAGPAVNLAICVVLVPAMWLAGASVTDVLNGQNDECGKTSQPK